MVGSGFMSLLSDPSQLARFVGATVALAAGVYTARESAKLGRQRLAAILGHSHNTSFFSSDFVLKTCLFFLYVQAGRRLCERRRGWRC